ncbi:chemotaxis protein CheC [Peribacillus sp. SCS-37]|uniref:chemotaxis protein CheC n=1 Tax=Paraperibacillus esterisolvens TaxID=3115296 RepID=UPI003905C0C6
MSIHREITSFQMDILREIGNIGAGNAATALSRLLNKKVDMKIPEVRVVSFDEMMEMAGGAETVTASVYFRIEGDAPGSLFFLLPVKQACRFVSLLSGDEMEADAETGFTEFGSSVLKELANILAGSYLSSLSDLTQLNIHPSIPYFCVDMAGAVISQGLLEISQSGDSAIVINTAMEREDGNGWNGHFFLIPDSASFEVIFKALGAHRYAG